MQVFISKIFSAALRMFFHLLYNQFAWTYDLVSSSVSVGMWNDWVVSIAGDLDGAYILELGHGPGHLQEALITANKNAFGLDKSPYMSGIAKKRLGNKGLSYALVSGESQHLPYPSNKFKCVAATFPTEYIISPDTLSEIYRVLISGGKLIIVPLAWITGRSLLHKAAALLFRITGQVSDWDENQLSPYSQAGFELETHFREIKASKVLVISAQKP
ncbi:MAG: methyltransferase domain-containing protein [Chloroflexi bacterium]|nr:methyltransferase domain-containing protein [Chloroflexota bacterium]